MNTTSNPLWSTFDAFQMDLPAVGARMALGHLVRALSRRRAELTFDQWKSSCTTVAGHPAMRQLLQDP